VIIVQIVIIYVALSNSAAQDWLSPRQKRISPLPRGEVPFCRGEMAETGEKW